ncbi:MAG: DUF4248 domain-containing protein [Bacteroides sp.]|nr:DUF4248 domain-containing protein [Bacteroides sp.]
MEKIKYIQKPVNEIRYFRELAMSYFPEDMPEVAVRKLRKEIVGYPELFNALKEVNYKSRKQIVTPLQKELIIKYLGEP